MTLPVLDGRCGPTGGATARFLSDLRRACAEYGAFYLHPSPLAPVQQRALEAAAAFFGLHPSDKQAIGIERSAHFRGYSRLRSGSDDREQVHFGPEAVATGNVAAGPSPARLLGPNLWPTALGTAWRTTLLEYVAAAGELGRRLLRSIAGAFELPEAELGGLLEPQPYLLMKLMRYGPRDARPRSRMAPHCDWSLITVLLQDGPGLQLCTREGAWLDAPSRENSLLINLGELAELATGGRARAAPHRVIEVGDRERLSIPVFINPDLSRTLTPFPRRSIAEWVEEDGTELGLGESEHVHRVQRHHPRASSSASRSGRARAWVGGATASSAQPPHSQNPSTRTCPTPPRRKPF
jgi:isopenicillin N synthase-like dioxygenase